MMRDDITAADAGVSDEEQDICVALTFDDGPHPVWTEKLLDGLKERGICATFFVIGENAEKNPELIRKMVENGNQVGNHTFSHVQLTSCRPDTAIDEITRTQEAVYKAANIYPLYIRPPYGAWNAYLQNETELKTVLWDVDPQDWKVQNTDQIVSSVMKQTKDGSIILLHDIFETSVEAALEIADIYLEAGYRFCTVEEIGIE